MIQIPYVADRSYVDAAQDLIQIFGTLAGYEAAARANNSRSLGNVVHFCKWRSVGRLIELFSTTPEGVTMH